MSRIIVAFLFLAFLAGCKDSTPEDLDKYTIDYALGSNRFAVVVAEDEGVSNRDAEKYAVQKAAQVAHAHGYRYFVINQESQVIVMKRDKASSDPDKPKNIYYALIQSNNFGKDRVESSDLSPSEQVPGYQVEFSCQEDKPESGKYYDVCDYGICD